MSAFAFLSLALLDPAAILPAVADVRVVRDAWLAAKPIRDGKLVFDDAKVAARRDAIARN